MEVCFNHAVAASPASSYTDASPASVISAIRDAVRYKTPPHSLTSAISWAVLVTCRRIGEPAHRLGDYERAEICQRRVMI